MFRVSRGETGFDADTLDQAQERPLQEEPGAYHVDAIRDDPSRSGHMSRAWGCLIRHADGTVQDEPNPWDAADQPPRRTYPRRWSGA